MVNNDLLREWPFNTRLPNQNTDVVCIILVLFYCKLLLVIYLFSEYTFFNRLLAIHHLVCVCLLSLDYTIMITASLKINLIFIEHYSMD